MEAPRVTGSAKLPFLASSSSSSCERSRYTKERPFLHKLLCNSLDFFSTRSTATASRSALGRTLAGRLGWKEADVACRPSGPPQNRSFGPRSAGGQRANKHLAQGLVLTTNVGPLKEIISLTKRRRLMFSRKSLSEAAKHGLYS